MSDATPVTTFADLVRTGRQRRGWSQEDLERESGVSRGSISRWERGLADRPEPENVRAVCRVLGIDPRQAAVSLGYLSAEEVEGPPHASGMPEEVEEILTMIGDPRMTEEDRRHWVEYLRYLHQRALNRAS